MINENSSLTKICKDCEKDKHLEEFPAAKKMADGYRSRCKACQIILDKNKTEEQKARRREIVQKSRNKNKEKYAEARRKNDREHHAANRDEINARARARNLADPKRRERKNDVHRAWLKANPDKLRKYRARMSTERTLGGNTALQSYVEILLKDPCSYCGAPSETIDHIEPVSKGGKHEVTNITGACKSCNSAKSDKPLLIFLVQRAHDAAGTNCYI